MLLSRTRSRGRNLRRPALLWIPPFVGAGVLVFLWLVGRSQNPGPIGFPLDDAWIHLVYGRGLGENGYFAYNPGTPGSGCTSPLWGLCLALLHRVFGGSTDAVVRATIVAGGLLHLLAIVAGASAARRAGGGDAAGVSAGLLIALAPALGLASFSGMEVALTSALLLLAIASLTGGNLRSAGVWIALATLARPEAGAVLMIAAAVTAGRGPHRLRSLSLVAVPSLIGFAGLAAYHLWASGSPLPATFYEKSAASVAALPARLSTALAEMFPGIPPFGLGLGWLALVGLVPGIGRGVSFPSAHLSFLGALAFLLGNLYVMDPVDPEAFYHLRYILPSVPLFLVALAVGAAGLGGRVRGRGRFVPSATLVALALVGAAVVAVPQSRRFHNDVRNINEVQRHIGEWLGAGLPAGTWIAASDAGAVRYFSNLPTIDVIGLNTPEATARSHAVAAIAFMPAWFAPVEGELDIVFQATTDRYTVTSNPRMATQVVGVAKGQPNGTARLRFRGFRSFELDFRTTGGGAP